MPGLRAGRRTAAAATPAAGCARLMSGKEGWGKGRACTFDARPQRLHERETKNTHNTEGKGESV